MREATKEVEEYYGQLAEFEAGFGSPPVLPYSMLLHRRHKLFGNINSGGYNNQPIVWLRIIEAVDIAVATHEAIRERLREQQRNANSHTR